MPEYRCLNCKGKFWFYVEKEYCYQCETNIRNNFIMR